MSTVTSHDWLDAALFGPVSGDESLAVNESLAVLREACEKFEADYRPVIAATLRAEFRKARRRRQRWLKGKRQ